MPKKKSRFNILYNSGIEPIVGLGTSKTNKSKSLMRSMDTYPGIDSLSSTELEEKYSNLMEMIEKTTPIEFHFLGTIKIRKIAGVNKVALFLSDDGTLYSSGFDEKRQGILGLDGKFEQARPVPNPTLLEHKIKGISIGETHACATDSKCNLYTWGTGLNGELGQDKIFNLLVPTKVNVADNVEIKEAKVAKGYTSFKTSGGYLFVMGDINLEK